MNIERQLMRIDFISRFKSRVIKRIGKTDRAKEIVDDLSPLFWDNDEDREKGPEACADDYLSSLRQL